MVGWVGQGAVEGSSLSANRVLKNGCFENRNCVCVVVL